MNSIIQCVSNTVPLGKAAPVTPRAFSNSSPLCAVNYFVTGNFEEDLNQHSESRGEVACEFAALLRSLWSHQFKSISPTDLKYTVGKYKVSIYLSWSRPHFLTIFLLSFLSLSLSHFVLYLLPFRLRELFLTLFSLFPILSLDLSH